MFIWPNPDAEEGFSVTGSVQVDALEAFRATLAAGGSLEPFAEFFPPNLTAADYRPEPAPEPAPEKRGPGRPRKAAAESKEE